MEQISIESLKKYGFKVNSENKLNKSIWLRIDVENWAIQYIEREGEFEQFYISADGGYDYNGEFDISHIKDIQTLDMLVRILTNKL